MKKAMLGNRRSTLRIGCGLAALALSGVMQTPQAGATGFQGTGTVVPGSGSASIIQGATSDTIIVDTPEVVIDWTPADTTGTGPIDFLPSVNSALYIDNSAAGLTDYTVLNRILPVDSGGNPVTTRPVTFNGTVTTQLGANNFPVGNVWFYSPGGIIAGPTAVFDVGGLVLTTNDIIFDTTNGLFGPGGEIRFAGTPGSTASVEMQAGSQVNIIQPGSYMALVAPRVVQDGTVDVNGSVAYVGAEAVDITINGGLFDIAISTGTSDANGVVHGGSTNVTADQGPQRIFMAAMPKNTALTMLLTGDFGYTAAAAAAFQDSAVILSAGHDIENGQSIGAPNGNSTQAANISIGNSSFAMSVEGRANGTIAFSPTSGGTIQFDDFAGFKAGASITGGADDGETINAAGDLDLHAGLDGTGGTATLYANGAPGSANPGQIGIGGRLTIGSDGFGPDAVAAGANGQDGTGGTSQLLINGGRVIADSISISANGFGGNGFDGGNGTGGNVLVSVQDGQLAVATTLDIFADGYGGAEEIDGTSGDGLGGTVLLELLPGSANNAAIVTDRLAASASGFGSGIDAFSQGNGGLGQGGSVRFDLLGGALGVITDMALGATGTGGQAAAAFSGPVYSAGDGIGGQAIFNLDGGFADVSSLAIFSTGEGGFAQAPSSVGLMGVAGNGTAGTSQFIATSGTATIGDLFVHAYGLGGATSDVFDSDATNGGNGFGGSAEFTFGGVATLDVTSLDLAAHGEGGAGGSGLSSVSTGNAGSGGTGTGGTAVMTLGPGDLTLAGFAIAANGTGGAGGDNQGTGDAGSGGDGFGGSAILDGIDANYAFAAVALEAMGIGGTSGNAVSGLPGTVGTGTGGLARVSNADTVTPVLGRSMDSLTLNVGATGASIFSGRAEISDTASFAGGGLVINGDLDVLGNGPEASLNSGFYYTGAGAGTSIGGTATIAVGGVSEFDLDGTGVFGVTGTLQISGGRNITVRHTNQSTTPTPSILAGTVDFDNFGYISGETGSLISSTGAMNLTSGLGYIDIDRLDSGGTATLDAANGTIRVGTDLQSAGLVLATGQSVDISTLGDIDFTTSVASAGNFTLNAGGTASFTADVTATDISVTSADIDIAPGASLIAAGSLALTNGDTSRATYIGGADTTAGYSLSAAEILRLFATDILIDAPAVGGITTLSVGSTRSPDLIIGDMSVQAGAGGNIPTTGSFTLSTPGKARVTGAVSFTGMGNGGTLAIFADDALEIIAGSGSIDLRDGNGALGGTLELFSDDIIAASPSTIDTMGAAGSLFERNNLLDVNDGAVNDNGYLRAGAINIGVVNGLYIQNSGAGTDSDARRGFTANSLSIFTEQGDAEIVINGRLTNASGGFSTGLAALGQVQINGQSTLASGYAAGSTINGCRIGSPSACIPSLPELDIPIRNEDIENQLTPSTDTDGPAGDDLPTVIIEIKEFEQMGFPPLIDEPVTGSGNDDLWTSGES